MVVRRGSVSFGRVEVEVEGGWDLGFWEERRRARVARVERDVRIVDVWMERWVLRADTKGR